MADGDFVLSSKSKVREGEVGFDRPNSEAINTKLAGNINALIDSSFHQMNFNWLGYFSDSNLFVQAPYRIQNDSDIIYYQLSVADSGNSANTILNANVYDDTGAFVNTLFATGAGRLLISGNNGSRVTIATDVVNTVNYTTNTGGHTIQAGTLNLTTLLAGYIVQPFFDDFAMSARSASFIVRLREQ